MELWPIIVKSPSLQGHQAIYSHWVVGFSVYKISLICSLIIKCIKIYLSSTYCLIWPNITSIWEQFQLILIMLIDDAVTLINVSAISCRLAEVIRHVHYWYTLRGRKTMNNIMILHALFMLLLIQICNTNFIHLACLAIGHHLEVNSWWYIWLFIWLVTRGLPVHVVSLEKPICQYKRSTALSVKKDYWFVNQKATL